MSTNIDHQRLVELINKQIDGIASEGEIQELDTIYNQFEEKPGITEYLTPIEKNTYRETIYLRICNLLNLTEQRDANSFVSPERPLWRFIRSAVAVLILLAVGTYFYNRNQPIGNQANPVNRFSEIVKPGGNKAILTLADGSEISLTDAHIGAITVEQGTTISKKADGQLVYHSTDQTDGNQHFNSIETPRGGKYQIQLPDGTKVWLNAVSSLHYPTKFSGKERTVELIGEAYFEVTKNPGIPFRIKTGTQTVEVLGTHFNIKSYREDKYISTTLLEGSVRVFKDANAVILKPGQQSHVFAGKSTIETVAVDANDVIAWKTGYFLFENSNIKDIMISLSRWYDIDVEYQGEITDQTYGGAFPQSIGINELLKYLETYGNVHFKVNGRRITVTP